MEMKGFMQAYALLIELFLYSYSDLLERGYSRKEALDITTKIITIILKTNFKEDNKND